MRRQNTKETGGSRRFLDCGALPPLSFLTGKQRKAVTQAATRPQVLAAGLMRRQIIKESGGKAPQSKTE
jgi:hypothetical protein